MSRQPVRRPEVEPARKVITLTAARGGAVCEHAGRDRLRIGDARVDGHAAVGVAGQHDAWHSGKPRLGTREAIEVPDRVLRNAREMADDPDDVWRRIDAHRRLQFPAHHVEHGRVVQAQRPPGRLPRPASRASARGPRARGPDRPTSPTARRACACPRSGESGSRSRSGDGRWRGPRTRGTRPPCRRSGCASSASASGMSSARTIRAVGAAPLARTMASASSGASPAMSSWYRPCLPRHRPDVDAGAYHVAEARRETADQVLCRRR